MDHQSRRAFVAALIGSIGTRTDDETDEVLHHVARRLWPGGSTDRTERRALEWVRLWQPKRMGPVAPVCRCHRGACELCN